MIKSTIIVSDNFFLIYGLIHLDSSGMLGKVDYCTEGLSSVKNLSAYDYIFLELSKNQTSLCINDLIKRNNRSHLFFIQKGLPSLENYGFLNCYSDATILNKSLSAQDAYETIKNTILYKKFPAVRFQDCCYNCRFASLSDTQLLILIGFKNGFRAQDMARVLNLSHKTIFSHIDRVRDSFKLRGSYDIFHFLQNELVCYRPVRMKK